MTTALDRVRTAMTLDDRLDDITQAHVWSRIEDALGPPARRAGRIVPIIAALAAAAVVVIIATRRSELTDELSAPPNTTLSAHLGPHTRAQLIGPARLEIVGAAGDTTRIRVRTGTLVAEFTGGAGRSLAIEAPGATIEIVGTVFAVEVVGDGSCVSVSHGTVRVRPSHGAEQLVTTGERWCTADPRLAPIPPALRDVLEQHAVHTASREAAPPPVAVPPVVSSPDATPTSIAVVHDAAPTTTRGGSPAAATTSIAVVHDVSHDAAPPTIAAAHDPTPTSTTATHDAAPPTIAAAHDAAPPVVASPTSASHDAAAMGGGARHDDVAVARPLSPGSPGPTVASVSMAPGVTAPRPAEPAVMQAPPPSGPEVAYDAAERALAKHDLAAADRALAQVTEGPASPLIAQALYERARIAYQQHAWGRGQRQLDRLAALGASPLTEPGAYLGCRIALAASDDGAERCFVEYHSAYPRSPHDLDVLGVLADVAYRTGGCARAATARDELARRYPQSALARGWAERCKEAR